MHEKVAFIHCYQLLKIMGLKDLKHITLIDDPYEEGTPEDRRKAQKWIDKNNFAKYGRGMRGRDETITTPFT